MRFGRDGRLQRGFQSCNAVGGGIRVQQDRKRLHQTEAGANDEHQGGRRLGQRLAAQRVAEYRSHEDDGAEQDVHRELRRDDHLEGFSLAADFYVGGGPRHIDRVAEQIGAAVAVEPHFLEAIEEIGQPVEQPAFPSRRLLLVCGQFLILVMENHARRDNYDGGDSEGRERQIRHVDADEHH